MEELIPPQEVGDERKSDLVLHPEVSKQDSEYKFYDKRRTFY